VTRVTVISKPLIGDITSHTTVTRRTDIEGLRALAVSLVVAYHAGITQLSGGFIGVDVFFVISGFLITSLLLREVEEKQSVDIREFWSRRIRRIVPMSLLVVAVTVIASVFMLEEQRMEDLAAVALGAIGFCANFVLYFTGGEYLSGVALPSPLQHYWSLAVEEQFYLVWPLVIYALARWTKDHFRNVLMMVIVIGGGLSLVASITITPSNPGAGYYLPHTRVWEILIGAGLAMIGSRISVVPKHIRAAAGWVGLLAIVIASLVFDSDTVFPGYLALIPVLGTALVITSGGAFFGPEKLLSLRPMQYIGARSYSWYLWHWPILVLFEAHFGVLSGFEIAILVAMSFALSMVTYDLVEQPVRHSQWLTHRPRRTLVAGFTAVAVMFGGGVAFAAVAPQLDNSPVLAVPDRIEQQDESIDDNNLNTESVTEQVSSTTTIPTPPVGRRVRALLVGDSTLAAFRWFDDGKESLSGFRFILDAEPCRRILYWGCVGREERMPDSTVDALERYSEDFDVIVLMAGYHSREHELKEELEVFARAAKIRQSKLVILTFKETLFFPAAGSQGEKSMYANFNRILYRTIAKNPEFSDVVLADWNYFSGTEESWFRSDGMHTTIEGTLALGWYISHVVAAVSGLPCPDTEITPCVIPEIADPSIDWFQKYNVKNTNRRCFEFGDTRERRCAG